MQENNKKISFKKFMKLVAVVLIFCCIGVIYFTVTKPTELKIQDKTVYTYKCRTFAGFVDKVNEVHYSDDKTLLDETIPEMIIYKDKAGNSYVLKLDGDVESAIQKMNELRYSTEYKVDTEYLTQVVFYY